MPFPLIWPIAVLITAVVGSFAVNAWLTSRSEEEARRNVRKLAKSGRSKVQSVYDEFAHEMSPEVRAEFERELHNK